MNRLRYLHILFILGLLLVLAGACEPAPPSTAAPAPPTPTLFWEPDLGRGPLLRLIRSASQELDITMYLFSDETMAQALERAAHRGVNVRLLLEMRPFGGGAINERMAQRLKRAGIHVRPANPAFRYTHEKSMVVDGTTGVIMTMNWTRSSFQRNREFGIIFRHPAWVEEMRRVFEADWQRTPPPRLKTQALVWSPINARERILAFIRGSQRELRVEHQNVEDPEVVAALIRAARRGVVVRIVCPPPSEDRQAAWGQLHALDRAGAKVRLLKHPYVHAKVLVADGKRGLLGSTNLTTTSLDFNRELSVIVEAPTVIAPLLRVMDEDWDNALPLTSKTRGPQHPLSPEETIHYVGQVVTVEGNVVRTHDTGKVTFLDLTRERQGFSVVIFARDYTKFPSPPASYYHKRRIRVRGRVQLYKGAPEIIVHSPEEIEIVK